ncbi:Rrf2 family transcriptional regulator [Xanthobacter sp. V4C-4]|uniref:Rrf2 family transcriptional regulator n=1 Tax=Xanthobacter cornucopiae TaxID=3119924 RepID=UPI00372BD857
MKLHYSTWYAIWAVVELAARPNAQVSASELAAKYGMSQHHLAKVLRTLSLAGIVESVRGPGGGCTFIGNAKRLTMYDLITLLEGDGEPHPPGGGELPPLAQEVNRVLDEIDRIAAATLKSVTIQTLINNGRRHAAPTAAKPAAVDDTGFSPPPWIVDI